MAGCAQPWCGVTRQFFEGGKRKRLLGQIRSRRHRRKPTGQHRISMGRRSIADGKCRIIPKPRARRRIGYWPTVIRIIRSFCWGFINAARLRGRLGCARVRQPGCRSTAERINRQPCDKCLRICCRQRHAETGSQSRLDGSWSGARKFTKQSFDRFGQRGTGSKLRAVVRVNVEEFEICAQCLHGLGCSRVGGQQ
jgi:hypothetical protein